MIRAYHLDVPRLADHQQRRRQITDAARTLVARDGLRAATFQAVAAEAGVSVRLVQYYFGSKEDVLRATREAVAADAGRRFAERLAELGEDAAPRDVIRGIVTEVLPIDARRREDAIVLDTFFLEALTGERSPDVPTDDPDGASQYLVEVVSQTIARSRTGSPEQEHADIDARLIVAAAAGLAQTMLVDSAIARRADEHIDRLLDRMLPASAKD